MSAMVISGEGQKLGGGQMSCIRRRAWPVSYHIPLLCGKATHQSAPRRPSCPICSFLVAASMVGGDVNTRSHRGERLSGHPSIFNTRRLAVDIYKNFKPRSHHMNRIDLNWHYCLYLYSKGIKVITSHELGFANFSVNSPTGIHDLVRCIRSQSGRSRWATYHSARRPVLTESRPKTVWPSFFLPAKPQTAQLVRSHWSRFASNVSNACVSYYSARCSGNGVL